MSTTGGDPFSRLRLVQGEAHHTGVGNTHPAQRPNLRVIDGSRSLPQCVHCSSYADEDPTIRECDRHGGHHVCDICYWHHVEVWVSGFAADTVAEARGER